MRYLALDIGTKRTGVAYGDDDVGIALALPTLTHNSMEELQEHVRALVKERRIDRLVVGLPLLPGGTEGSQATLVREAAAPLQSEGISVDFIDERHTTSKKPKRRSRKHAPDIPRGDPDSVAASQILEMRWAIDNRNIMS